MAARFHYTSRNGGHWRVDDIVVKAASGDGSSPAAPGNLTRGGGSETTVVLNWADNSSNEVGFRIECSTNNRDWTLIGSTTANVTHFTDAGLACGTSGYRLPDSDDGAGRGTEVQRHCALHEQRVAGASLDFGSGTVPLIRAPRIGTSSLDLAQRIGLPEFPISKKSENESTGKKEAFKLKLVVDGRPRCMSRRWPVPICPTTSAGQPAWQGIGGKVGLAVKCSPGIPIAPYNLVVLSGVRGSVAIGMDDTSISRASVSSSSRASSPRPWSSPTRTASSAPSIPRSTRASKWTSSPSRMCRS